MRGLRKRKALNYFLMAEVVQLVFCYIEKKKENSSEEIPTKYLRFNITLPQN